MQWTLHFDREVVEAMYTIPAEVWRQIKSVIWALQEDPTPHTMQADEENPSWYWIALPGDHIVTYEIIDEEHEIRIVDNE
jgi:hypothetical protein